MWSRSCTARPSAPTRSCKRAAPRPASSPPAAFQRALDRPHPHAGNVRPHLEQAHAAGAAPPPRRDRRAHRRRRQRGQSRSTNQASSAPSSSSLSDGIEAVAICFINSYRNAAHERQAEAFIKSRHPDLPVSASYAVLPEIKEYERTSTTVVNAYLLSAMRDYLDRLKIGLHRIGVSAPIMVMTSNGGMLTARGAAEKPVMVVASEPGGRRHRRRAARASARLAKSHCLRHGRHHGQGGSRRKRPPEHDVGI